MTYDPYAKRLNASLKELPENAHEKILATLNDRTQEITTGQWSTLLEYKGKKEPQPCGCLMLDGYYKDNPPQIVDFKDYLGQPRKMLKLDGKNAGDLNWKDMLADYYGSPDMTYNEKMDLRDNIDEVAQAFDMYCKYSGGDNPPTKWVAGNTVLNARGRREIIKMLEKIIDGNKKSVVFE